ncbi:MAG: hypothetical protein DHS20C06_09280 [Hyphobacterium sp.]|nr:MAG: hypothetical protein DHS20C06_09280 [Hyphobacterium sp.]
MTDTWLESLQTPSAQAGYDLAVTLARRAIREIQPEAGVRAHLRETYARDADALIASSAVVATHFQTIAAANHYWREN